MNEFEFIAITLLLVILVVLTADWIITKYRRQKTLIPKEDFEGQLNDLDKIIEGVSTDGTTPSKPENTTDDENQEKQTDEHEHNHEENEENKENKETNDSSKSTTKNSTSLKNAMITKDILTPKHSDKK